MSIFYLIIFFIPDCLSENLIRASLSHNENRPEILHLGEIFQAVIKMAPVKEEELYQFKQIGGLLIANSVYISELKEISYENHTVKITATAIFKKYLDHKSVHIWEFNRKKNTIKTT